MTSLPRGDRDRDEPRGEVLDGRERQRREQRARAQQRELALRDRRRRLEARQPRPAHHGEQRQAAHRPRRARPRSRTAPPRTGASTRAEAGAGDVGALDDPEDARQHLVGDEPLHQRQARHLDPRVADAEHDEQRHRHARARPGRDQAERHAGEHAAAREPARDPPAPQDGQRRGAAEQPADAPGGVEPADAARSHVEQLERGHHHEHVDRALDERAWRRGRRRAAAAAARRRTVSIPERASRSSRAPGSGSRCAGARVVRDAVDEQRGEHEVGRGDARSASSGLVAATSDAAEDRADQEAGVVDPAPGGVGGGELLGRARERRQQRGLRGLDRRRGDREARREQRGRRRTARRRRPPRRRA